ncbi:MAG: TrmH family RNA methyltransferase [Muribaculaceae bacterium]|nr:TrmH family RNA methyltransferase [Muribaculaceae bacterium]
MKKKNIIELTRIDISGYRELKKLPIKVMCDNVRSMYNIGAVFRTSDAFLIDEVILGGISGCPPHPEISKTALGAEESVRWRHVDDAFAETLRLQREDWKIVVLEQVHGSVPLQDYHRMEDERTVLVVGNEVEGVDERIVKVADVCVEIPQFGTKHSLNVSCSTAIALWQIIF